jgi:hypothetical protein
LTTNTLFYLAFHTPLEIDLEAPAGNEETTFLADKYLLEFLLRYLALLE